MCIYIYIYIYMYTHIHIYIDNIIHNYSTSMIDNTQLRASAPFRTSAAADGRAQRPRRGV